MKKICGWVVMCLVVVPLFVQSQRGAQKETPLTPNERMDKLFDFWNRLDQPGFAVVVVKDGHVLYQKVFGLACQEHAVPITLNSVFNIATAAQPFVGQAIALLEKQGKLSLDDDVRKFIPEIPDFGTPVKLRHLLYHCSGFRDWLPVLQLTGGDKEEVTIERVLGIVKTQKRLIFRPGERSQYSNSNYDLLAEIIKRAIGKPFSDWTWENVFRPMKMTRTQFRDNCRSIFDGQAFSYNFTRQEYLRGVDNLSLTGSHSLFTSIADLTKWLANLGTDPSGNRDVFGKMFTPGKLNNGSSSGFGYGLSVGSEGGRRRVAQSGTWAGSGAVLNFYPDQKFGFAVLANWDYTPVEGFVRGIVDIYLPVPAPQTKMSPPAAKKDIKVSPEKLNLYAGDYRLGPSQIFTIGCAADQLYLQIPGQKFALTALSETEFLWDLAEVQIAFQKDKEGKVQQLIWNQGGDERVVPKVVLVRPTPEELKEFAGTYFNDELNVRLGLDMSGGALVIRAPDRAEVRLAPDEKDHFTTRAAAFPMIVFQRDAQNRVTGLVIDSDAFRDLIFRKD